MAKKVNFNCLFWISYAFLIFSEMFINIKYFSSMSDMLTLIGILGLCLFILLKNQSYSFKFIILFLFLLGCSIFSYLKLNDFTVLKLLLLLVSLKNIPFEDFVKKEFKIRSFMFLMVFILSLVGFSIGNYFFVRGSIKRYTLGFSHPNIAGFYLFLLAVEYIYINRKKMKFQNYIFPIIMAVLIQVLTNSRTSFLALIFVILAVLYINNSNNRLFNSKVFKFFGSNLFIILSLIIYIVVYLYNSGNELAINLNELLSNRIFYYTNFINKYQIKLFGNSFDTYILDNSYLHLLLRFGLVTYIFYYLIFSKKIKDAFLKKDYTLVIIFIVMLFFGLMENSIYKSTFNIFLLSFSEIIFFKNKGGKNYEE